MSRYRVDLRSDTVTTPSDAMRRAMASAEVGDDWYGDDPTVNRLQERAAEITGKEAALFVPTGTMANQIGLRLQFRGTGHFVVAGSAVCSPCRLVVCAFACDLFRHGRNLPGFHASPHSHREARRRPSRT